MKDKFSDLRERGGGGGERERGGETNRQTDRQRQRDRGSRSEKDV